MKSYEMFGPAGDRACQAMVDSITRKISSSQRVTPEDLSALIEKNLEKIRIRFPEVDDSEPPSHIAEELNKALAQNYYSFTLNRYLEIN